MNISYILELEKGIVPLNEVKLPKEKIEGIYAYWWIGKNDLLKSLNRKVCIKGKWDKETNENISHIMHWDWNFDKEKVCLYVGKSTDIKERVKLHLRGAKDWYKVTEKKYLDYQLVKHTSSCQFRAGLEHLYKNRGVGITLEEKKTQIGFSYLEERSFAKRFYMEDFAIGHYLPWFNIDSER